MPVNLPSADSMKQLKKITEKPKLMKSKKGK